MKKGEVFEGVISQIDFPNKGYVEVDGNRVVVKNGIPGQKIHGFVNKKRGQRLEARLMEVIEKSPLEKREPICSNFPACGGCMYQTMAYEDQLAMKYDQLKRLFDEAITRCGQVDDAGNPDYILEGIHPSPDTESYRNKMEFSFGDAVKDGPLTLGLHKKGSTYDILTTDDCKLVHEDMCLILRTVLDFFTEYPASYYHKMQHKGYLRHLLLRRSRSTGEILINLVTTSQEEHDLEPLKDRLLALGEEKLTGKIAGILHIINDSMADVVQSDETHLLYGVDYFYESILGLKFKITPFSFFQTNSAGAEVLYSVARSYIGDTKDQTVFDLYSGTGTIGQMMASVAGKVVGVEIVEEAVVAARENATLNGLDNCTFLAGDVLKMLDEIEERPDFIILDPPRDGVHPKALKKIIDYGVDRMVYISCKPTSLARDLEILISCGYHVDKMCFVDMFVNTVHCESVCLLSKLPVESRQESNPIKANDKTNAKNTIVLIPEVKGDENFMINLTELSQYIDRKILELFAINKPFTQNLTKWQDDGLKDKYDHNYFEYAAQPSEEEYKKAIACQKERGDHFIKLEGSFPLENSFGIKAGITLTMALKEDRPAWKTNLDVSIATPTIEELEEIELKHYGEIYGRDFTIRNIRHEYEKLKYIGAYLDEKLVGACYYFAANGAACMDGLLVDTDYRGKYVATTIIEEVVKRTQGSVLFLHADDDDTPKEMYKKMGFEVVNKVYEYTCTEL